MLDHQLYWKVLYSKGFWLKREKQIKQNTQIVPPNHFFIAAGIQAILLVLLIQNYSWKNVKDLSMCSEIYAGLPFSFPF